MLCGLWRKVSQAQRLNRRNVHLITQYTNGPKFKYDLARRSVHFEECSIIPSGIFPYLKCAKMHRELAYSTVNCYSLNTATKSGSSSRKAIPHNCIYGGFIRLVWGFLVILLFYNEQVSSGHPTQEAAWDWMSSLEDSIDSILVALLLVNIIFAALC